MPREPPQIGSRPSQALPRVDDDPTHRTSPSELPHTFGSNTTTEPTPMPTRTSPSC